VVVVVVVVVVFVSMILIVVLLYCDDVKCEEMKIFASLLLFDE